MFKLFQDKSERSRESKTIKLIPKRYSKSSATLKEVGILKRK